MLFIAILNKNNKKIVNYAIDNTVIVNEENKNIIEESFKSAVLEAKDMYKTNGEENFDIYFGTDFLNNFMENGICTIINNINEVDFTGVRIYDFSGNNLESFPTIFADGKEIQYENDMYQVAPNKNYLMKIYSHNDEYCYYYILQYTANGSASIQEICFTIGEKIETSNGYEE
jgi:hypothetical protein